MTLHITNGDHSAERIRLAGITGHVVPWRDVLHEGPVPAGLSATALSEMRTRFIVEQGWGELERVRRDFVERDAAVARCREHEEVVLWFEHDLFDQLQLIQVLDGLARWDLGGTRLSLVCEPEYLGMMGPGRMVGHHERRRAVTAEQLDLGRRAWAAFTAPDPTRIEALLADETHTLRFLGPALGRLLEEFPAAGNGLSRSERQALEALLDGEVMLKDAFVAAHHKREDPIFLGDTVFFSYVDRLGRGAHPLVRRAADRVALTDTGRDVLAGRLDLLALNGIDRWLGGVHLAPGLPIWRWEAVAGELVGPEFLDQI